MTNQNCLNSLLFLVMLGILWIIGMKPIAIDHHNWVHWKKLEQVWNNEKSKLFNLPILCDAWHIVDYRDENHNYDDDDGNDDVDDCVDDGNDDLYIIGAVCDVFAYFAFLPFLDTFGSKNKRKSV